MSIEDHYDEGLPIDSVWPAVDQIRARMARSANPCEEMWQDFVKREPISPFDPEVNDMYQQIVATQARLRELKQQQEKSMKEYVAKMIDDIMRAELPKIEIRLPRYTGKNVFYPYYIVSPPKPPAKDYLKVVSGV